MKLVVAKDSSGDHPSPTPPPPIFVSSLHLLSVSWIVPGPPEGNSYAHSVQERLFHSFLINSLNSPSSPMGSAHSHQSYLSMNHPAWYPSRIKIWLLKTYYFIHSSDIYWIPIVYQLLRRELLFHKGFSQEIYLRTKLLKWTRKNNEEVNVFRCRAIVTWNHALSFLATRAKREISYIGISTRRRK